MIPRDSLSSSSCFMSSRKLNGTRRRAWTTGGTDGSTVNLAALSSLEWQVWVPGMLQLNYCWSICSRDKKVASDFQPLKSQSIWPFPCCISLETSMSSEHCTWVFKNSWSGKTWCKVIRIHAECGGTVSVFTPGMITRLRVFSVPLPATCFTLVLERQTLAHWFSFWQFRRTEPYAGPFFLGCKWCLDQVLS